MYETNFPPDRTFRYRKAHGAMKPPELMAEIVSFFTKAGERVLDPFAGVGGTLLGAELVGRTAVGIEINSAWVEIYRKIQTELKQSGQEIGGSELVLGDCLTVMHQLPDQSFAAIITDPPYGCHHATKGFKEETNFNMFSASNGDFGNCVSYDAYLEKIREFGYEAYRLLKAKRYLVLLIGDRFYQGEFVPLGTMVAETMRSVGFKWKGIKIWWNKATQRPLKPYAVKSCFVPNITHQNILILRKE